MAQGILPFKYELERSEAGMTALAGLPLYMDLAKVVEISRSIQRHLWKRDNGQGWRNGQVVTALIMLNLVGGELPSGDFGENAAWWWIMVLSLNLNVIMKRLV